MDAVYDLHTYLVHISAVFTCIYSIWYRPGPTESAQNGMDTLYSLKLPPKSHAVQIVHNALGVLSLERVIAAGPLKTRVSALHHRLSQPIQ